MSDCDTSLRSLRRNILFAIGVTAFIPGFRPAMTMRQMTPCGIARLSFEYHAGDAVIPRPPAPQAPLPRDESEEKPAPTSHKNLFQHSLDNNPRIIYTISIPRTRGVYR